MSKITWTNCADAMSPKVPMLVICKWPEALNYLSIQTTEFLWQCLNPHAKWTPYTSEKWKELNKWKCTKLELT